MSTESQWPAIANSPCSPYCLLRSGFIGFMGSRVQSSDLTLWSGLCLRKDEILLWVFSGLLDIEGPTDSNEYKKLMYFPSVNF